MPDTLLAPEIEWTSEKVQTFESLFAAALAQGAGAWIDYQAPYPRYEFLCYLVERKAVLVHGSNNPEILVFTPRRQTDYLGRYITAVFAASDGIWPIYFAIIDRANYRGSLRNGCGWRKDPDGVRRKHYRFSINQEMLAGNPWISGTIYLLPRDSFEQVKGQDGELLEEWASPNEVTPLARLRIEPQDFPFLNDVQGHEDGLSALAEILLTTYQRMEALEDGFAFEYTWEQPGWSKICDFIRLLRDAAPPARLEIEISAENGPLWLRLHGPPDFVSAISESIRVFKEPTWQGDGHG